MRNTFLFGVLSVAISLLVGVQVQAQETCKPDYLNYLSDYKLHSTLIQFVEQSCPDFVTDFNYAKALVATNDQQKLALLIEFDLIRATTLEQQILKNNMYQDVYFQTKSYKDYRIALPSINYSSLSIRSSDFNDLNSAFKQFGVNTRYVNVDLLFAMRNWDFQFLQKHKPILEDPSFVLYPEVRTLYNKALIADKLVASPGLSALLSAIIPGSGRLTHNRYFDALNSALLIFGSAYLTYRHWDDTPVNLIFGGMTTTFYLSNIYGSYQGAVKANQANKLRVQFDAEHTYYTLPPYLN